MVFQPFAKFTIEMHKRENKVKKKGGITIPPDGGSKWKLLLRKDVLIQVVELDLFSSAYYDPDDAPSQ